MDETLRKAKGEDLRGTLRPCSPSRTRKADQSHLAKLSEVLSLGLLRFCYLSWLARCYIMSNEPGQAWEAYVRMDTSNESFNLLHLIANDCYKMGHFYYACKAFDVLERLDPDPEFWEGKRGAAVGVFQRVVARKESPDKLQEVVNLLRGSSNSQALLLNCHSNRTA